MSGDSGTWHRIRGWPMTSKVTRECRNSLKMPEVALMKCVALPPPVHAWRGAGRKHGAFNGRGRHGFRRTLGRKGEARIDRGREGRGRGEGKRERKRR